MQSVPINSTNINKMNNHSILTELIEHKKTTTCGIRNPGLGFGPGTKMNIQPVKGIPTHPS
jgi:hypothetical protein